MSKTRLVVLGLFLGLLVGPCTLPLATAPAGAQGTPVEVGVGFQGGACLPIAQDDAEPGSQFGGRVRVGFLPWLGAEVGYYSSALGDKSLTVYGHKGTIDGGTLSQLTGTALFTFMAGPIALRPFAGLGSYTLDRDAGKSTDFGLLFGLEFGVAAAAGLEVEAGARIDAVLLEDGGSRKYAGLYGGILYNFLR